jgi:trans-aconitate 2-methyltransferase
LGSRSDHRLRPQIELLDRVPHASPDLIYDLGCGAGAGTRIIASRWPAATVYGIDSSAEMLQQASVEPGPVTWVQADISTWQPDEPADLIYTNATLQWVPGHLELFPRLVSFLRPGGCLAVQMPLSWTAPSHVLMRDTLMTAGPGGTPLGTEELHTAVARKWVDGAEWYYDLLVKRVKMLDIWETEYLQVLHGVDPVLEWVSGTGLRPILNGLDDAERAVFLDVYRQRLRAAYPVRANGETLYPFKRLFIVATV